MFSIPAFPSRPQKSHGTRKCYSTKLSDKFQGQQNCIQSHSYAYVAAYDYNLMLKVIKDVTYIIK